jgi:hypothetical protein
MMTAYNLNNFSKIAQFNPVKGTDDTTPIFIFTFEELPTNYRISFNVALLGLIINQKYHLKLQINDNTDRIIVNSIVDIDTSLFSFPEDKLITPGVGATSLTLTSPSFTIADANNNTYGAHLTFTDEDNKKFDEAHTFFFAKKENK